MSLPLIPHIRVPIAGASVCADPWYTWLQAVQRQASVSMDVDSLVSEIATKLGSPDGSIAGIPAPSEAAGKVIGLKSLQSFGSLEAGQVTLTLRNDVNVPGNAEYYGSSAAGARGWHAVSDTMAQGVGLTLTVGADGVTTFDLADLADSGAGTFKLLTRDAQGRLSGTADGDTDDVPEGAGNLYYTDVRADGRITAQKGQPNGVATLDASSKLDAGQLPALAITETSVVADEAAMLALTVQQGDVAVRTDVQTSFILTAEPASTLANWQELLTPTAGAVTSFNGRTGSVVPASGDYTAAQVGADPAGTAAAIVAATITNGDTTHAPSGDAVFDALAGKFDKAGGTVTGATAFVASPLDVSAPSGAAQVRVNSNSSVSDFIFQDGGVTKWVFRKNAGNEFELSAFGGAGASLAVSHVTGDTRPGGADNTKNLGLAAQRWKEIFSGNATINTSDAREKFLFRDLSPAELATALDLARLQPLWKWIAAIAEKGESLARWHCSPTVQDCIAVMEAHDLDPFAYGFICYDEWGETPEVRDEESGEVMQEYRQAGDRYSLRPSELEAFCRRGMMQKIDSIDARLAALGG